MSGSLKEQLSKMQGSLSGFCIHKGRTIFLSEGGGGGGGYCFWDLKTIFLRVMRFKQFFSLHFAMKTIFLRSFYKNITGFFIDLI